MSARAAVEEVIEAFGRSAGLDPLKLDASGTALLVFDGDLFVEIAMDEPSDTVALSLRLGPTPAGSGELLLRLALRSNGLWRETDGLIMALDPANGELLQIRRLPAAQLDLATFERELERFVQTGESWRGAIEFAAGSGARQVGAEELADLLPGGEFLFRA